MTDKLTLLWARLHAEGFSDAEIQLFLDIYNSVCPHCLDNDKGCQCWNDD